MLAFYLINENVYRQWFHVFLSRLGCTWRFSFQADWWHTKCCEKKLLFLRNEFLVYFFIISTEEENLTSGKEKWIATEFYNAPSNRKCINRLISFKLNVLCHFAVLCFSIFYSQRSESLASISWSIVRSLLPLTTLLLRLNDLRTECSFMLFFVKTVWPYINSLIGACSSSNLDHHDEQLELLQINLQVQVESQDSTFQMTSCQILLIIAKLDPWQNLRKNRFHASYLDSWIWH